MVGEVFMNGTLAGTAAPMAGPGIQDLLMQLFAQRAIAGGAGQNTLAGDAMTDATLPHNALPGPIPTVDRGPGAFSGALSGASAQFTPPQPRPVADPMAVMSGAGLPHNASPPAPPVMDRGPGAFSLPSLASSAPEPVPVPDPMAAMADPAMPHNALPQAIPPTPREPGAFSRMVNALGLGGPDVAAASPTAAPPPVPMPNPRRDMAPPPPAAAPDVPAGAFAPPPGNMVPEGFPGAGAFGAGLPPVPRPKPPVPTPAPPAVSEPMPIVPPAATFAGGPRGAPMQGAPAGQGGLGALAFSNAGAPSGAAGGAFSPPAPAGGAREALGRQGAFGGLSREELGLMLLRGGLGTMQAAGKPGANTLGSIGAGGNMALDDLMARRKLDARREAAEADDERTEGRQMRLAAFRERLRRGRDGGDRIDDPKRSDSLKARAADDFFKIIESGETFDTESRLNVIRSAEKRAVSAINSGRDPAYADTFAQLVLDEYASLLDQPDLTPEDAKAIDAAYKAFVKKLK